MVSTTKLYPSLATEHVRINQDRQGSGKAKRTEEMGSLVVLRSVGALVLRGCVVNNFGLGKASLRWMVSKSVAFER